MTMGPEAVISTTTAQETDQSVDIAALEAMLDAVFHSTYYGASDLFAAAPVSGATDRYALYLPNDGSVRIGTKRMYWDCGGSVATRKLSLATAANWDTQAVVDYTVAANRAGVNQYLYACDPGSGYTPVFKFSANSTYPAGYDANTSRKVAGFHCLCVAVDHQTTLTAWTADTVMAAGQTIKATVWDGYIYRCTAIAGDFKTHAVTEPNWASIAVGATIVDDQVTWVKELHALEGYASGDVLPKSVFDKAYLWPLAGPEGKVYINLSNRAVDIYLQSGTGSATASVYGGTIVHSRSGINHGRDMAAVQKQLPLEREFREYAFGSPIDSVIGGGVDPATTGGLSDAYGRRSISDVGVEDATNNHYQWLASQVSGVSRLLMGGTYLTPGSFYKCGSGDELTYINVGASARGVSACTGQTIL